MAYFITGGTGFIGKRLAVRLCQRGEPVYVLVRKGSEGKFRQLQTIAGEQGALLHAVTGDLNAPMLGLDTEIIEKLRDTIQHFFHLGAVYDLRASPESQLQASIDGTQHAADVAEALNAGCFHLVSSIAAAGLYPGVFREDMFDEAVGLHHPYFRGKHDAERIIRAGYDGPWRIYRPGFVVGDSRTGEMDKVDGPYYFFPLLKTLREWLPSWMPVIGLEGGYFNIVPVDFVVAALDHIAHAPGEDGGTFHLVDPRGYRLGRILDLFARAAHAPAAPLRLNTRVWEWLPSSLRHGVSETPPIRQIKQAVLDRLGIPEDVLGFLTWPTRYDASQAQRVLAGSGIHVPPLESYADRLWDYWERHVDRTRFPDRKLARDLHGQVVVITGGSSGIGKATAAKLAANGARVVIVARGEQAMRETCEDIRLRGGNIRYYQADLADMDSIDATCARILEDMDHVDVLVNNAGRSIRRAIEYEYDRFHDFERTMQLNYFGCIRMTLRLLPSMVERRQGHVVNISSIGVLSNAPRFSAYVASKAALEAFSRCAAAEFAHKGVHFSTINMPLVRTPMIAPTRLYQHVPTLTPEQAADLVAHVIRDKPERYATKLGKFAQIVHAVSPTASQRIMNAAFRLFPDSEAAIGSDNQHHVPFDPRSPQALLMRALKGIHW